MTILTIAIALLEKLAVRLSSDPETQILLPYHKENSRSPLAQQLSTEEDHQWVQRLIERPSNLP
jgi:hypothetical protein